MVSEKQLRNIIRQELDTQPKKQIVSIKKFRQMTGLSYGEVRYMYETSHPHLFSEKKEKGKGRQRRVNYTEYIKAA